MSNDFDEFERDLLIMAGDYKKGKYAKSFLKKEGKKLINIQKDVSKSLVKEKTGYFKKHFKVGKPYNYRGQSFAIRGYNNSPHAHLINNGHRVISHGVEKGFRPGVDYIKKSENKFKDQFFDDTQKFIDDLLNEHGMG